MIGKMATRMVKNQVLIIVKLSGPVGSVFKIERRRKPTKHEIRYSK